MIHLLDKNVLCACCTSETILGSGNRKANEAQMLRLDWQIQRRKSLHPAGWEVQQGKSRVLWVTRKGLSPGLGGEGPWCLLGNLKDEQQLGVWGGERLIQQRSERPRGESLGVQEPHVSHHVWFEQSVEKRLEMFLEEAKARWWKVLWGIRMLH